MYARRWTIRGHRMRDRLAGSEKLECSVIGDWKDV